jgi:hypothetical protein
MNNFLKAAAISFSVLILSACGGGGGGGGSGGGASTPTSAGTAEGLWTGTTSNGYGVSLLVLENAETWGIYYSGNTIWGSLYGTSTGSGTVFSATGTDFYFATRESVQGTLSGTVNAGVSISATSSGSGLTANLIYNNSYNTPASLATIAGRYTGWGITRDTLAQTLSFQVSSAGVITGAVPGCSVSGTILPRASGKNVFNVSTTFTGNLCALGSGTTTTGIATLDSTSGVNRLFIMTLNGAKTDGFVLNATSSGVPGTAATVPAAQAVSNWAQTPLNQSFNVYTTSGCYGTFNTQKTNASQSAQFEGALRNYSTSTTTIRFSNCTPSSTTGTGQDFYDSNFAPLGYTVLSGSPSNNAFYGVYSGTPNIPLSLTAGASGSIGTELLYTNSSKTTSAGRRVVTYTSAAETSLSLLLNITSQVYDTNSNLTYTERNTYRITTAGVATLLALEVEYANGVIAYFR